MVISVSPSNTATTRTHSGSFTSATLSRVGSRKELFRATVRGGMRAIMNVVPNVELLKSCSSR